MARPVSGCPKARTERLIMRELDGEVLVYDLNDDRAHNLNPTAATIWELCDGTHPTAEIARLASERFGAPVDEQTVWYALHELAQKDLLDASGLPDSVTPISRRQLMRRAGLVVAAVAIPTVTSIVAPTVAEAVTCFTTGQPCTSTLQCCAGHTCQNITNGVGTCS